MAERSAWIMVIGTPLARSCSASWTPAASLSMSRITSHPQLLTLAAQVFGHVLVDVLEHRCGARYPAVEQGAVLFGFLLRGQHFGFQFGLQGLVLGVGPPALVGQVTPQAADRIAQREVGPFVRRTVARGIVRGRVRAGAVGDPFDQRR